jgi:histidine decarboxylase
METLSKVAISRAGVPMVSSPSQDPQDLASYTALPGITNHIYQIPSTGLSEGERTSAHEELWGYLHDIGERHIGYQGNSDFKDVEPVIPYLSKEIRAHPSNTGDPFINGFNQNTKVMERNVLDYYASLWHAKWPHNSDDPESYWGYMLNMGSTEGTLQACWTARNYFRGKLTKGDVLMLKNSFKSAKVKPTCPPDNPNALSPVAFYSSSSHNGVIKALEMLLVPSFGELGNDKYPHDNPLNPGSPWPDSVPTNNGDDQPLGTIHVPSLLKLVDFFSSKGHPVLILLTYGTAFEGAYDDIRACGEGVLSILEKNNMLSYKICYDGEDPNEVFTTRQGYWFHIDAALAGTYAPFLEMANEQGLIDEFPQSVFDFRLSFVSSIVTSIYKWVASPWPSGILMTKTKYCLLSTHVEYLQSNDCTVSGSRNGINPVVLWSYCSSNSYDQQVDSIVYCLNLAKYAHCKMKELEAELKDDLYVYRAPASLAVLFKRPNDVIVNKFTLCCSDLTIDGQLRHYAHLYAMPSVTKEMIDNFIEDLKRPEAFAKEN